MRETTITTSQPRSEPVLAAVAAVRSHSDDYDYEVATPDPAPQMGGGKARFCFFCFFLPFFLLTLVAGEAELAREQQPLGRGGLAPPLGRHA